MTPEQAERMVTLLFGIYFCCCLGLGLGIAMVILHGL